MAGRSLAELSWFEAARLAAEASIENVDGVQRQLLTQRTFFVVCKECEQRLPWGQTNGTICHGCMQRNHGVVF